MAEKKARNERTRNWTFIVYPESAIENWRDVLDNEHVPWVESPLHDKDLNATGEQKKEHWHVLLLYEGMKSFSQINELAMKINATIPQKTASAKGLIRYMAHLDNPEKAQYDKSKIISHGGVDVSEYLKPLSSTRYQEIKNMMMYVRENKITELTELLDYAMAEKFDDWFPLLCDNSAFIVDAYIKSQRHGIRPKTRYIDKETGEIIE